LATPLYSFLKENGSTPYVFPGAAEDISYNFKMTIIMLNLVSMFC